MEVSVRAESVSHLCPTPMTSRVFTTKETLDSYKFGISYPISIFRCLMLIQESMNGVSMVAGMEDLCGPTAQARSDRGWPCCMCC